MSPTVERTLTLLQAAMGSSRLLCPAFAFPVLRTGSISRSHASSGCRLLNMLEPAGDNHELLVVTRAAKTKDKVDSNRDFEDRLKSLSSSMDAKHGSRVAFEPFKDENGGSTWPPGEYRCELPLFRLLREGLLIDEYHAHGSQLYEEELTKRVEAALSLSRKDDSSTLKHLWSPDVAGLCYRDEMAVAIYAVQVASTVARELQEELCQQGAISKMDSSPVTVADFSVQAIVLGVLHRYFPDYGFIAEETSAILRQDPDALAMVLEVVRKALQPGLTQAELCLAIDLGGRGHEKHGCERGRDGRTWVLDPIDGTKGFLRGEQFCVALGLLEGGRPVAGVLGCPNLPVEDDAHPGNCVSDGTSTKTSRGLLYSAAVGQGTFVRALTGGGDDTRRVMVDHARRPSETCVLESVEASHSSHGVAGDIACDLGIHLPPIRMDSQCKYGLLAQGQGGIYLRLPRWGYIENIWDHAAGAIIIQEAGGSVSDSRGMPLDFSLGAKLPREVVGIVATNGKIHAEVVRAVHDRQTEDWARIVAEAKDKVWESGNLAPPLPGVDWAFGGEQDLEHLDADWWATAMEQRDPLVMRTSGQFYSALRRGWDKIVAVLFHGSWTQDSQHAICILQQLAGRQHRLHHYSFPPKTPRSRDGLTAGEGGTAVVLAEADVMSLIDVADRQAIAKLPSLHLHLGGREIVRFPVDRGESAASVGARIDEIAQRVERATARL